eukprot:TRINITY_DN5034_c0_g1_i1.p1 TRINITY_DN5034_c0_g1~~TRINITY_DN5034_c0_g1_i1.p1  ORF type:complete len:441 (+),score=80.62 TRINITY_DN5034_c0_g1_i1:28-1323(+)
MHLGKFGLPHHRKGTAAAAGGGEATTPAATSSAFGDASATTTSTTRVSSGSGGVGAHHPPFGGTLLDALIDKKGEKHTIPPFLEASFVYIEERALNTEGLFREPGSKTDMQDLVAKINAHRPVQISDVKNPHTVAGLIKSYFRELKEPLIPFRLYEPILRTVTKAPGGGMRLDTRQLRTLLSSMPTENSVVMKRLLGFLKCISQHSDANKMTAANLGMFFGPALLRYEDVGDLGRLVTNASEVNFLGEQLILFPDHEQLFVQPVAEEDAPSAKALRKKKKEGQPKKKKTKAPKGEPQDKERVVVDNKATMALAERSMEQLGALETTDVTASSFAVWLVLDLPKGQCDKATSWPEYDEQADLYIVGDQIHLYPDTHPFVAVFISEVYAVSDSSRYFYIVLGTPSSNRTLHITLLHHTRGRIQNGHNIWNQGG